jgi:uncharacterized protein (DUF58 family)
VVRGSADTEPLHRVAPTPRGRLLMLTGFTWLGVGLLAEVPLVSALASLVIVFVCMTYLASSAQQARLSHGAFSLTAYGMGSEEVLQGVRAYAGVPTTIQVRPSGEGTWANNDFHMRPQTTDTLEVTVESQGRDGAVIALTSQRIGDGFLQGFHIHQPGVAGLFMTSFWAPLRVRVQTLPRLYHSGKGVSLRATRNAVRAQASAIVARRRGFGLELRELRDYQPGDSFRSIAWRATAKRRKVVCREYESDLSVSGWVALDVSPSMFRGLPGQARIDYGLNTTFNLLHAMDRMGHRTGLILFDSTVRHVVAQGVGRAHIKRVTEALLEVNTLFHEERTEAGDREVVQSVAQWFLTQEGKQFELSGTAYADPSNLDLARLASAVRSRLHQYIEAEHGGRSVLALDGYALEPHMSLFRAFARYAGIPLPLESMERPHAQSYGLASMLERVIETPRGPHTVVAISDLHTATDHAAIRRAALATRRQRHSVVLFCPSDPLFDAQPGRGPSVLQSALRDASAMASRQRLREVRAALSPAGVSFLHCGPQDVLGRLLERLRRAA